MFKITKKNYKGLTLIEAIINIYVYTILMLVCMAVSVSYIRIRTQLRQSEQAVEELSLAMNQMAKEVRMSNYTISYDGCYGGCGGDVVAVQRNSGGILAYKFDGNNLMVAPNGAGTETLYLDNVQGEFNTNTADPNKIPLLTISIWKLNKDGTIMSGTNMQTSVSFRNNYRVTGP